MNNNIQVQVCKQTFLEIKKSLVLFWCFNDSYITYGYFSCVIYFKYIKQTSIYFT